MFSRLISKIATISAPVTTHIHMVYLLVEINYLVEFVLKYLMTDKRSNKVVNVALYYTRNTIETTCILMGGPNKCSDLL